MTFDHISRGRRGLVRGAALLLGALALVALVWLVRSPADVPGALQAASPASDAHLAKTPGSVQLDFGRLSVDGSRATVAVVGPDDVDLARGAASTNGSTVLQRVAPPQQRGAYQVSYHLVAADGHATSGRYWFWYAPHASAWASAPWSTAGVLLGLMALATIGLALVGNRRAVPVPPGPPLPLVVPAQRNRDNHEGVSVPGRGPGRSPRRLRRRSPTTRR
jgi:methionine-rich copper-binding protein CopC